MRTSNPKYYRRRFNKLWKELEKDIQNQFDKKDSTFVLSGSWKQYITTSKGLKVYAVNGDWVRNNLSVIFGHGGHGYVHEFIPKNEIWISTCHEKNCTCLGVAKDRKVSEKYFKSCTLHEITEFFEMSKGIPYYKAHEIANKAEIKLGLLKNPGIENYK